MSMSAGVAAEPDSALILRDRMLAAFLADGTANLIRRDDRVASLRLASGPQVDLIACPASVAPSELRPIVASLQVP